MRPVVLSSIAATALLAASAVAQTVQPQFKPGVLVKVYDIGQPMQAIPELAGGQLPNVVCVKPTVDLRTEDHGFGDLKDNFYTEVDAFLTVKDAGEYAFRLFSDDGSKLWIDRKVVIDNDGLHGADTPKAGSVKLDAGRHALRVRHFDATVDERLTLEWKPPGADEFALIPADALMYDTTAMCDTAPGTKKIIPSLRHGLPGDGSPVVGEHQGFTVVEPKWAQRQRNLVVRAQFVQRIPEQNVLLKEGDVSDWSTTGVATVWIPASDGTRAYALPGSQYDGQFLINSQPEQRRVSLEDINGTTQGSAFRFACSREIPHEAKDDVAFEMLTVQAKSNGFEIEFTKPLDARCGWEADSYYIEQWPFNVAASKGPARDAVCYPVKSASVAEDRKRVFLEIDGLKESHVVYIRLLPPCVDEDGERPWSTEAWYTLNKIPADNPGKVLAPPTPAPQNFLTEEEKAEGWELLFDGKTTAGWHGYGKEGMPAGWAVENGCLVRVGPGGDIVTDDVYDSFELSIDWRICANGNSGIFFHVRDGDDYVFRTGPEMQVLDNDEHYDGKRPLTSAGSNYALIAPIKDVTQPVGLFNTARLIVNGNHVEHWLNGVKLLEYELHSDEWKELVANSKFARMPDYGLETTGYVALQDHGDQVWYRNIKIRRLGGE